LLALTIAAVALYGFWPGGVARLGALLCSAERRPRRCFIGLAAAAVLAYVPTAILFTPWRWNDHGPLALQFCRPLLYAVYYFVGLAIGAYGIERGLLSPRGMLARDWRLWLALTASSLVTWMGLTALTMGGNGASPASLLQVAADISFAVAGAASLFLVMAATLRLGAGHWPVLDSLAKNAMGIYLLHYAPVVWLQYELLQPALPAFAKASIVFVAASLASWAATAMLRAIPPGRWLIGEEPRQSPNAVHATGSVARGGRLRPDPTPGEHL
jgi:glucan biosynthesis protein C